MKQSSTEIAEFRELCQQWHRVAARMKQARKVAAQRDKEYCATPDGLAESQRRIDLCTDPDELAELITAHRKGQTAAAAEYRARLANNPTADPRDGILVSLPLGEYTPLARLLVATQVMGTARIQPGHDGDIAVQLVRKHTNETWIRRSFWYPLPTSAPASLPGVVRHVYSGSATRTLAVVFGEAYPQLTEVLGTAIDGVGSDV